MSISNTGEYEIDADDVSGGVKLSQRVPNAKIYILRVGYSAALLYGRPLRGASIVINGHVNDRITIDATTNGPVYHHPSRRLTPMTTMVATTPMLPPTRT